MLSFSIEEQRKRWPSSKLCLASGLREQTKQTKIYHRIVIFYYFKCIRLVLKSNGNAARFSNLVCGRRRQTKQTQIYYTIVHFYIFKCSRLVLKSKGNAGLFSNFVSRMDMRGDRSGGQGQPSHTEIYYRIVYFYGFK